MSNTIEDFNFGSLEAATGIDTFADDDKGWQEDTRFYKLTKDESGKGAALIRFLPDKNKRTIIKLQKINTNITKNGKRRFVSEWSPVNIGLKDPFQEKWAELWNKGDKEGSKVFNRTFRYIANIKVINDPKKPENNGKIFLLDMSSRMNDKLEKYLKISDEDKMLGKQVKELFNPLKGYSFLYQCEKGSNGMITYDSSEAVAKEDSIYKSVEEAIQDIKENTYALEDLLKPENYLSYEELQQKLKYVTFQDVETVSASPSPSPETLTTSTTQQNVASPANVENVASAPQSVKAPEAPKTQSNELDALLQGLV